MSADLVIRGGTVVDGTGAAGRRADVAVTDGQISEIGDRLDGRRELDASGQIVSPGFIDIHSHYDAQVFWDPALTPSSFHGVTSVVAGNCGFSIAPCRPEHRALLARTLQHVEDMDLATLEAGIPWDFETFPQYLDSVARHGTALNYGVYVGHTAVRLWVMGEEGYERELPTDAELAQMQAVVRDAMQAGAMGFATSSSATHNGDEGRPVPSRLAGRAELEALLEPLHDLNKGVAALLPGEKIKHADVHEIQQRLGRPLTWTALLTIKGFPWHEDIIKANDAARARGRPGLAADLGAPARVPDEHAGAVHVQHGARVRRADGRARRAAARALRRSGLAPEGAARSRQQGVPPPQLGLPGSGREHRAPRARRPACGRDRDRARLHGARRHARHVARREPRDPLPFRPRQQRPRSDRLAPRT